MDVELEMEAKEEIPVVSAPTNTNAVEMDKKKKKNKKMKKFKSMIPENDLVRLGVKRQGDRFYGRLHADLKQNTTFEGKLIGFDKRSYAYVHILERKVEKDYWNFKQTYFANSRLFAPLKLNHVHVGELVVAKLEARGFSRVRVLSKRKDQLLVLDVDEEKTAEVFEQQIFSMPVQLMILPFKSVKVQLTGLEMFAGTNVVGHVITAGNLNVGHVFKVTVKKAGLVPSVKMSLEQSNDGNPIQVSLNDTILTAIRDFRPMPQVLKKNMTLKDGIISNADTKGHIWYQFPSPVVELLHRLRPRPDCATEGQSWFTKKEILAMIKSGTDTFAAPMYCNRNSGEYCRVKILGIPKVYYSEKAEVECVDSGVLKMIPVDHLLPLENFDKIYSEIPAQCLKLSLPHNDELSPVDLYHSRTYVMNYVVMITKEQSEDGLPMALMWIYYPDVQKRTPKDANKPSRKILGEDHAFYKL